MVARMKRSGRTFTAVVHMSEGKGRGWGQGVTLNIEVPPSHILSGARGGPSILSLPLYMEKQYDLVMIC